MAVMSKSKKPVQSIAQEVTAKVDVTKVTAAQDGAKDTQVLKDEEHKLGLVPGDGPMGSLTIKMGVTKNLGNFESLRFDVAMTHPFSPGDEEAVFTYAQSWVDGKVTALNEAAAGNGNG